MTETDIEQNKIDQSIIDQYKTEISSLHAPKDLILQTKNKISLEKQKIKATKKRKVYYAYAVAAAALLFVCLLAFPLKDTKQESPKIYLGNQGSQIYLGEQIEIMHMSILPLEFSQDTSWTEEIDDIQVIFAIGENNTYMAAFESESTYVVVKGDITKKEDFKELMKQLLMQ